MSREAHIPLALWVSAAIVFHLAGGESAHEVARAVQDRAHIRAIVHSVRDGLRPADTTFEVLTDATDPTPTEQKAAPPKDDGEEDPNAKPDPNEPPDPNAKSTKPPPTKPKDAKPKDEPKKEEPKKEEPKPEVKPEPTPPVAVPQPVAPAPPPPPMAPDHRIAIRQHAEKNQPDNPNAARLADEANHVQEETVAKIRSHDQDMENPQLGGKPFQGPTKDEGDSDTDKTADSEDHKGDPTHAPGEKDDKSTTATHSAPEPVKPSNAEHPTVASVPGSKASGARNPAPHTPAAQAPKEGGAGPASPEVVAGDRGSYTVDPANPGGDGQGKTAGKKRAGFVVPKVNLDGLGFGKAGVAGGPQLNLDEKGLRAAVGDEKLAQERAADGAARRSKHRGSFEGDKFQKWKAAIENYEPSVKLGNQTSLNAARSVFATYLNTIHNRIHPIFAEEFLDSLGNASASNPMNKMDLVTHVEIVLSKDQGKIVRMGVTKNSGSTPFDLIALNSVHRAQPFGKAPDAIVSPDGNVYLHWEFHRDPFDACTTRNARPFLLKAAPTLAPVAPKPGKAPGPASADDGRSGPLLPLAPR